VVGRHHARQAQARAEANRRQRRRPDPRAGRTRLRRRVDATVVVAQGQRRTISEAGDAYIAHLENVMERKRTTIADYRGYLRRHLAPFFGDRPMDRIDPGKVEAYLHAKRRDRLSPKTVQNHLNFLGPAQAANPVSIDGRVWTRNPHRSPHPNPEVRTAPFGPLRQSAAKWRRACFCLFAATTVLQLAPIGSSRTADVVPMQRTQTGPARWRFSSSSIAHQISRPAGFRGPSASRPS
jgi:hypothetical protein